MILCEVCSNITAATSELPCVTSKRAMSSRSFMCFSCSVTVVAGETVGL